MPVLVGARHEPDLLPVEALEAGDGVAGHGGVRVADVGRVVHVVDRGGDGERGGGRGGGWGGGGGGRGQRERCRGEEAPGTAAGGEEAEEHGTKIRRASAPMFGTTVVNVGV